METAKLVWAIVSTILAGGGFIVIKNFIKESKELIETIKEAMLPDDETSELITTEEAQKIAKEALDVYAEGLKLWNIIRKLLPVPKKK